MADKLQYKLHGGIGAIYSFDSLQGVIDRIDKWFDQELIDEKECAAFIIQLFHQIPEETYNDIINKTSQ